MKVAEALILRADLQKKLESLRDRISKNVLIQEGESPSENPDKLFAEVERYSLELQNLIFNINMANMNGKTAKGRTLTDALAHRDILVLKHAIYQSSVNAAMKPPERYGAKEIRWIKTVNVQGLQDKIEILAKEIREVNTEIQSANWQIEMDA